MRLRETSVRGLLYIAVCAALISICAWITVPAAIPFTMQTFGIFLTLLLLRGRRGTVAVIVYLLLGAAGLPVFSGMTGGAGVLFGVTGGYLIGFLLTALTDWVAERFLPDREWIRLTALLLGLALCYVAGTCWFMVAYAKKAGPIALTAALSWCVFPFIVPDLVKLMLAFALSKRLKSVIREDARS